MLKKLLCFSLACTLLQAQATTITIDQSIKLNPEEKSQTISISLDEVPSKLIKNGVVKDGKIAVKLKLSKKDKKNFSLDPKNGKVVIDVVDGIVQPATLTITAKEEAEFGIYDFNLKPSKKFRKNISVKKDDIEYNNVKTVSGQVDLSNIVSSSESLTLKKANLNSADLQVDIYDYDPITKVLGELITSVNTNTDGTFIAELPLQQDFGAGIFCQTQLPDEQILRSFIVDDEPIINAQSDFFVDFIDSSNIDLQLISDPDFAELFNQVARDPITASSVDAVKSEMSDIYDLILEEFADNQSNPGTATLPGSFDGFDVEFLLGQAFTGNDNNGQPILGQYFGANIRNSRLTVDSNQNGAFLMKSKPIKIDQVSVIAPTNDANNLGNAVFIAGSSDTAKDQELFYTTVNQKDNCLIMSSPAQSLDAEKEALSSKSSAIYDAIFEEETGLLTGSSRDASALDGAEEDPFIKADSAVLPIYVQNLSDLEGDSDTKELRNPNIKFVLFDSLSLITLLGFSALSVDYNRLGVSRVQTETATCSAILAALSVYRAECNNLSATELNVEKTAAEYIFDTNLVLDGVEQDGDVDFKMGVYDWESSETDRELILKAPDKVNLDANREADLILKPLFGVDDDLNSESVSAYRYRDIILVTDLTHHLTEEEAEARATLMFLYNLTNSNNGLPLLTSTTYKTYGISFEFSSTAAALRQISGTATVTPVESSNSYDWLIVDEVYKKSTASLNNADANNLAPSKTTDTASNETLRSVYNSGQAVHIFSGIHETTRQCQFPSDKLFVCQIFSTGATDDSNSGAKSVGLIYGLKVEE